MLDLLDLPRFMEQVFGERMRPDHVFGAAQDAFTFESLESLAEAVLKTISAQKHFPETLGGFCVLDVLERNHIIRRNVPPRHDVEVSDSRRRQPIRRVVPKT